MAYRYTTDKNKQANQRYREHQQRRRSSAVKKSVATSTKTAAKSKRGSKLPAGRVASKSKSASKRSLKSVKAKRPRQVTLFLQFMLGAVQLVASLLAMSLMVWAIAAIMLKMVLPRFFYLDADTTLLLVGADPTQQADKIYLVRILPYSQNVQVVKLEAKMLVPVVNGHDSYPLQSVAPLLRRENGPTVNMQANFSQSLNTPLDKVYFISDLGEIDDLDDLRSVMWHILGSEGFQDEFARIFFQLYQTGVMTVSQAQTLEEIAVKGPMLGREVLVDCPLTLVNAAGQNGLVGRMSDLLTNSGLRILMKTTGSQTLEQSVIYYDQNSTDCLKLLTTAQQLFPKIEAIADGGESAKNYLSKAIIFVGRDLADKQ